MVGRESPVVASLTPRSPHPYSSIALSPSRQHAVAAGKDTLKVISVGPSGLSELRSLRVSQVRRNCSFYLKILPEERGAVLTFSALLAFSSAGVNILILPREAPMQEGET